MLSRFQTKPKRTSSSNRNVLRGNNFFLQIKIGNSVPFSMGPSSNRNVLRVNFLQTKPFSMGPCGKARVAKVREKSGKVRFYSGKTCFFFIRSGNF